MIQQVDAPPHAAMRPALFQLAADCPPGKSIIQSVIRLSSPFRKNIPVLA
jgi:hypothetical protein